MIEFFVVITRPVITMLTAFIMSYLVYDWGTKTNAAMKRKNPLDYEDEE